MSALRRLRNFWIPWVATIVLACLSNALAQASYTVSDLGVLHNGDNAVCAMAVNNHGWTEIMDGNNSGGTLRAATTLFQKLAGVGLLRDRQAF